jgi:uncharacterized membrane protein YesL
VNNILNSRIYLLLEKFSNLLILNLVWIVACLPIFTIFPATAAMFSVIRQWKLNDENSVIKPFIKYLKINFKQSFIIELFLFPCVMLLVFDFYYILQSDSNIMIYLLIPLFLITILVISMTTFLFPVMVHYQLSIKDLFKNSVILSFIHLPTTFLLIMSGIAILGLIYLLPITSIILFSIGSLINYMLCNRIFDRIERLKTSKSN